VWNPHTQACVCAADTTWDSTLRACVLPRLCENVEVEGAGFGPANGLYRRTRGANEWVNANGSKILFYWPKLEEHADFHLRGWGISFAPNHR
jgi:hypothetical protein